MIPQYLVSLPYDLDYCEVTDNTRLFFGNIRPVYQLVPVHLDLSKDGTKLVGISVGDIFIQSYRLFCVRQIGLSSLRLWVVATLSCG